MKVANYLLFLAGMLAFSGNLTAQTPNPKPNPGGCGVIGYRDWFDWYREHRHDWDTDIERGADSTWIYAPVTVHLVGRNDGTGAFRVDEAVRALCEMNEQFAPSFIRFYLSDDHPFTFPNNTTWFDHDWDGGSDLINSNNIADRLNAYVVADPAGNCGYSWQDAIVLGKGCSNSGNSTWAHEAGHHFSLPHTFLGWEGENASPGVPAPSQIGWNDVEKLDGSNCSSAGDYFCDTEADYLSYRWGCNDQQRSNVVLTDPTGTDFQVDATPYMSYALDACQNRFSAEQTEAMRANLYTEHSSYLWTFEPGPMLDDNASVQLSSPVDSQTAQYNNVNLKWEPVPGADIYVVEVGLFQSFSLILQSKAVYNGETSLTLPKPVPNNRLLYWRVRAFSYWDLCQPQTAVQVGIFKSVNLSATNDLERVASIELTPNPVVGGGIAKLAVDITESLDAQLSVTDASGRLVHNRNVRLDFGSNLFDIETNDMPAGIYQVSLQTPKGIVVKRLSVLD